MPRSAELSTSERARRARSAGRAALLGLALLAAPTPAFAEPPLVSGSPLAQAEGAPGGRPEALRVSAEIGPVLDLAGSSLSHGHAELLVRIRNGDSKPIKGEARVHAQSYGRNLGYVAPFTVAAGATAQIHIPVELREPVNAEVVLDDGRKVTARELTVGFDSTVRILDLYDPPRSRAVVDGLAVATDFQPQAYGGRYSSNDVRLRVASAAIDSATGAPILPRHGVGYQATHLVIAPTELLARLDGAELESLASFVLAGGTLALGVSKPEDLRHPTVVALLGGEATEAATPEIARALLPWPQRPGVAAPYGVRTPPTPAPPGEGVVLRGYTGGNLAPSHFGASASYGLGEVLLLAFDPSKPASLDDGFVQIRLAELARRAFDRTAHVVAPLGREAGPSFAYYGGPFGSYDPYDAIRKQLDPSRTARWGIGLATVLICIYAVLAGPVSFNAAKKRNQPLSALRRLPLLALAAFGLVVLIGVVAKGLGRRSQHLSFVDAGAGMSRAVVRRYRGFFAPDAGTLTVRAGELTSSVSLASSLERPIKFEVDRDGARLLDLDTMPAETIVVREDGLASIGDGISIVADRGDDVIVKNRTGRPLRALVVRTPGGNFVRAERLDDGESLSTSAMSSGKSSFGNWTRAIVARPAGAITLRDLGAHGIVDAFDDFGERELGEAWAAVGQSLGDDVDWWPPGVPVLLAQIDGGEGIARDSGITVQRARLLVRVTGWGGAP